MPDTEFQKNVLETLESLKEGQSRLEGNVSRLEEGQSRLEGNVSRLETKIDRLANEGQQDITALLQLINTKLDATATKGDIARIEDVLDVLAARSTRQEADILNLKRAK
ncbi:MAG: hypothetical protein WA131_11065 [Desulfitobacteriaceae bacterium]